MYFASHADCHLNGGWKVPGVDRGTGCEDHGAYRWDDDAGRSIPSNGRLILDTMMTLLY